MNDLVPPVPAPSRRSVLTWSALAGFTALTASACSSGTSRAADPSTSAFWSSTWR